MSFLQIHGVHDMAARKRKKAGATKRKASPAKRKTAAAGKSKSKPAAKRPARKSAKTAKKSVKTAAKKAPARTARRKTKGEGDYAASRAFLKDQAGFVEKNKDRELPSLEYRKPQIVLPSVVATVIWIGCSTPC